MGLKKHALNVIGQELDERLATFKRDANEGTKRFLENAIIAYRYAAGLTEAEIKAELTAAKSNAIVGIFMRRAFESTGVRKSFRPIQQLYAPLSATT